MSRNVLTSSVVTLLIASSIPRTFAQGVFEVTRPEPGDTLQLSGTAGDNQIYIDWTVPPGTEDSPALITLQSGEDIESLQTLETVNGSAINDGSYTWNGADSISLASGSGSSLASTACNYTIRLATDGLVAYSRYFTVINDNDGPISDSTTCPIERGVSRPQFSDPGATGAILGASNPADANTATSSSGDNSNGSGGGGGISQSTLAVAVAVPIVALILIFGLLLWLGIRKGWFIKWTKRDRMESRPGVTDGDGIMTGYSTYAYQVPPEQEKKSEAPLSPPPPGELHGDERPWEAEGTAVHQLEGDERDVDMGRGYMRAR